MDDLKHLSSGWSLDSALPYHFEHIPLKKAESMREASTEGLYVVETVNWTLADEKTVHFNKYFAMGLPSAVALAARIEIAAGEIAENLVAIRAATEDEQDIFWRVYDHYEHEPPALSDDQASDLEE